MFRSSSAKIAAGVVAVLAVLALLRFHPWQQAAHGPTHIGPNADARQALTVGVSARHLPPDLPRDRLRLQAQHHRHQLQLAALHRIPAHRGRAESREASRPPL